MGWAEDQAKRIRDAQARAQEHREHQARIEDERRRVIQTDAPRFFQTLADHLETFTHRFNAEMGETAIQCERGPGEIVLSKPSVPARSLRVGFQPSGQRVRLRQRTLTQDGPDDEDDLLRFSVNETGALCLDGIADPEKLAQRLLGERIFKLFEPQPF